MQIQRDIAFYGSLWSYVILRDKHGLITAATAADYAREGRDRGARARLAAGKFDSAEMWTRAR